MPPSTAFHNEHDPHQAPRASVESFPHIRSDTYKVTAALIETMDEQVGRLIDALNRTGMLATTVIGKHAPAQRIYTVLFV